MWANRAWIGRWFPADTPPGHELEVYTSWCTTVEGNTTFYATPDASTVARWGEQTPDSFRFCFKLPRTITHERRLRNTEQALDSFLRRIEPLGARLGPIQIQLPASFGPTDLNALAAFIDEVPTEFRWAVEVRHPAFFAGGDAERPLDDLLAANGVNRVILDSRALFAAPAITEAERDAYAAKPRLPVRPVATADEPLVRLIGQSDIDRTLAMWQPWFTKLAEWLTQGLRPHVFAHTPDNRDAPELARLVWGEVNQRLASSGPDPGADPGESRLSRLLEPLPTARRPSEQLRLGGADSGR